MDYSAIFGERAGSYIEACERWPDVRSEEISAFMQQLELKPGEDFLDAPCGNGLVARHVPADCHYKGIDPATPFVDFCRSRGLDCHQGSLRHSGLDSSSYDVIGSLAGIHHEKNRFQLYQEWTRLLRPGGRLVVLDVEKETPTAEFLNGFVNHWNPGGHEGWFLDDSDCHDLLLSGLIGLTKTRLTYRWWSKSREDMASFMTRLFGLSYGPKMQDFCSAWQLLGYTEESNGFAVEWSLLSLCLLKPEDRASL